MPKVAVAMSGGVDSSVAAALLLEQGYEVEGIFMKNWSPESGQALSDCPWEQDQTDAASCCERLGIPFRSLNFEREYRERVVEYFLREYAAGRTPNPDVMCNREIKFEAFLREALSGGAELIATGHYARRSQNERGTQLLRGVDNGKDQSYFLYTLKGEPLRRTIFPLGALKKEEVRGEAERFGLPTAQKKDSQGICFIGQIDLKSYLLDQLGSRPGESWLLPAYTPQSSLEERIAQSQPVGEHHGAAFYTIGERMGSTVNNARYRLLVDEVDIPPTYLLAKEVATNRLYLSIDPQDPHFLASRLEIEEFNFTGGERELPCQEIVEWLTGEIAEGELFCQIRYQQKKLSKVQEVRMGENGRVILILAALPSFPLARAVAAGQSAVLYGSKNERVIGGGVIYSAEL